MTFTDIMLSGRPTQRTIHCLTPVTSEVLNRQNWSKVEKFPTVVAWGKGDRETEWGTQGDFLE